MYGLIGKITVAAGQRDTFANILRQGTLNMPGCSSYIVAEDSQSADLLWVMEVWQDAQSHANSLSLPSVREAIAKGRHLIVSMERVAETKIS